MRIVLTHSIHSFSFSALDEFVKDFLYPIEVTSYSGEIKDSDYVLVPFNSKELNVLTKSFDLTLVKKIRPHYSPNLFFKGSEEQIEEILVLEEEVPFHREVFRKNPLPARTRIVPQFENLETLPENVGVISHVDFIPGFKSKKIDLGKTSGVVDFGVFRTSRGKDSIFSIELF